MFEHGFHLPLCDAGKPTQEIVDTRRLPMTRMKNSTGLFVMTFCAKPTALPIDVIVSLRRMYGRLWIQAGHGNGRINSVRNVVYTPTLIQCIFELSGQVMEELKLAIQQTITVRGSVSTIFGQMRRRPFWRMGQISRNGITGERKVPTFFLS